MKQCQLTMMANWWSVAAPFKTYPKIQGENTTTNFVGFMTVPTTLGMNILL